MKYVVALIVHVTVEATSPQAAERLAFEQKDALRKSPDARVTAATHVRTAP